MLDKKIIEKIEAPGVYKKPFEGEGLVVALPGGSGWSIHISETGDVKVIEGPLTIS